MKTFKNNRFAKKNSIEETNSDYSLFVREQSRCSISLSA